MNEEQFAEVVENYSSFVYNVAYPMMFPRTMSTTWCRTRSYPPIGLKIDFVVTHR